MFCRKHFKKYLLEFSKKSVKSSCFYNKIGYNSENTILKEIIYAIEKVALRSGSDLECGPSFGSLW